MKHILTVFRKEVLDNLRDRRTITSSIIGAFFTPALLLGLIVVLGKTLVVNPEEKPLALPVVGAEYAPGLISFLEEQNVVIEPAPADPVTAVKNGDEDIVLIISPDYPEAFRQGQPAPVSAVLDSSRQTSSASIQRVNQLITTYSRTIGQLRLQALGVDATILNAISTGVRDVATPQSQALIFLNMMPFLIILNIFGGGTNVIIDATAGERERGSLEPLLINPVKRWQFVLGKLLASLPFALSMLALVLVIFWAGFKIVNVEEYIGFPMQLDWRSLLAIFLLALPVVLLASALQMLAASFTRSFKEAQTYLSLLPLLIGLPSMFLSFVPVKGGWLNMAVPSYGQSILFNQILRGEPVLTQHVLLVSVMTLVVSAVLTYVSVKLYERERILFAKA